MRRMVCAAVVVLAGAATAQSTKDAKIMEAAIRLKQAHVERSWEECKAKGASDERCKKLLEIIHEREKKVIARLAPAMSDPAVNLDQLNTEMSACYSPNNNYTQLVDCWERLADRLDAAREGKFLLKR